MLSMEITWTQLVWTALLALSALVLLWMALLHNLMSFGSKY